MERRGVEKSMKAILPLLGVILVVSSLLLREHTKTRTYEVTCNEARLFAQKYKVKTVVIPSSYLGVNYYDFKIKNVSYYNPKDVVKEF